MEERKAKRKLTAILSADVKVYSHLMQDDEEATVRTITEYRGVMSSLIQEHDGRVVDAKGDNLLAEFPSVVDAVRCGVEIQRELKVKNADLPENRKMEFRIGINFGDVIEEGDTIYGDGVNIAARLEGLAAAIGGAVAIIIVVGALAVWNYYFRPQFEPASVERMAFPLPDKPSIAVMPFTNMGADPEQEFFSDGLTEEIITALSKVPKLFVIARNSTFTYKGKPVKVKQVAEELGVRYVLEGSVRKAGDKIRITAQLIDVLAGHHLWAERYDRNLNDILAVQDEITKKIITAMQVKLTEGEQARAAAKGTNNIEAYLKYLQAMDYIYQFNIEGNALGKKSAEEAIALDPEYAWAYRALARTHMMDAWLGTTKSPKQSLAKTKELLQKAIALDETYAEAHGMLGFLFSMTGKHNKAVATAEHAVALNPNSAYTHAILGHTLRFAGRWEEAIPEYKKAIRLNPIPPNQYFFGLGLAYAWTGQYEEAIKWCEKAVRQEPDSFLAHLMMAVTYSLSGREEEARAEGAEVFRINPKFSLKKFEKRCTGKDKERFIGALRKAGLK